MHSHSWVAILAGGEGRRLASLTRDTGGRPVPKQFWDFAGGGTPFAHALERARSLVPDARIIVLAQETQRPWWEPALTGADGVHVVSQSANRGTGIALLEALQLALRRDRDPHFVVLPSDQEVDDEPVWRHWIRRIQASAREWPDHVVLLAAEAQNDADFGWIVTRAESRDGTRGVAEFHEKPAGRIATELALRGALCSTLTFAGSARGLLDLFHRHARPVLDGFRTLVADRDATHRPRRPRFVAPFSCDFSRDLLEQAIDDLRVVPLPSCGWTDLGTPDRVARWRARRAPRRLDPSKRPLRDFAEPEGVRPYALL